MENKQKVFFKDLLTLFWTFFKIGLFTFGGGYAMLPMIEKEIIEKRGWMDENGVSDMVAVAEATPGPIAVNLATFVGYQRGRVLGSLAATLGIVLPSFIIIVIVSVFLSFVSGNVWVESAFRGIRAGVVALIINAGIKMAKQVEKAVITVLLTVLSFGVATFLNIDVVFIIIFGGLFGIIYKTAETKRKMKKQEENDQ